MLFDEYEYRRKYARTTKYKLRNWVVTYIQSSILAKISSLPHILTNPCAFHYIDLLKNKSSGGDANDDDDNAFRDKSTNMFYNNTNPNILEELFDANDVNLLSENPAAFHILRTADKRNLWRIQWCAFAAQNNHPDAAQFMLSHREKWWRIAHTHDFRHAVSRNPAMIPIIRRFPQCISWATLSQNPADDAVDMLIANADNINWKRFCINPNRKAVAFLLLPENRNHIDWEFFSTNNSALAIEFMSRQKNLDSVDTEMLCSNCSEAAMTLLQALCPNTDTFTCNHWLNLCRNPFATHFFEQGQCPYHSFVCLTFKHPAVFEIDYAFYRKRMDTIRQELIAAVFHPRRVQRYLQLFPDAFHNDSDFMFG